MRFVDTNVLLYAHDRSAGHKREIASALLTELWGTRSGVLSTQVLQEFYVTVVRRIAVPLSASEALRWIEQFEVFPCLAIDRALVKIAVETSERYQIPYWDAAVIAATEALGAETLYTEDLSHGTLYGSVRVVNPFRLRAR